MGDKLCPNVWCFHLGYICNSFCHVFILLEQLTKLCICTIFIHKWLLNLYIIWLTKSYHHSSVWLLEAASSYKPRDTVWPPVCDFFISMCDPYKRADDLCIASAMFYQVSCRNLLKNVPKNVSVSAFSDLLKNFVWLEVLISIFHSIGAIKRQTVTWTMLY